jgi:hypothetical protein
VLLAKMLPATGRHFSWTLIIEGLNLLAVERKKLHACRVHIAVCYLVRYQVLKAVTMKKTAF